MVVDCIEYSVGYFIQMLLNLHQEAYHSLCDTWERILALMSSILIFFLGILYQYPDAAQLHLEAQLLTDI